MNAATETFTCELTIPGRKSPAVFVRDADAASHAWYATGTHGGRQGFGLSHPNDSGLMRIYPITRRGMPGECLPFWVREVVSGGAPRLEVIA
jgi:hypothetical protein